MVRGVGVAHARAQAADELRDHLGGFAAQRHHGLHAFRDDRRELGLVLLGAATSRTSPSIARRAAAAPALAMPRKTFTRAPLRLTTMPGLSSVPANRLPTMTVSAPAPMAFATSPPAADAAVGDERHAVRRDTAAAHSATAENWGTPTPATTRVEHTEPGPTPTLIASAPAAIRSSAPSAVATFPAMTSISPTHSLTSPMALEGLLHVTMGDVQHQRVRAGVAERLRPLQVIAANADGGGNRESSTRVLGRVGPLLALQQVARG